MGHARAGLANALAAIALATAASACGGQLDSTPEVGAPVDGGADDVSMLDAGVPPSQDSSVPIDVTTTLDAPTSSDAPGSDATAPAREASVDASPSDALQDIGVADAPDDVSADAARDCIDLCQLGDTQCDYFAYSCSDGGWPICLESGLSACVQGSSGCTEWGPQTACVAAVACCSCHITACFDGSTSLCDLCPSGPSGSPCMQDTDCGTNACDAVTRTCVEDPCRDHRQDGMETDVDCGGGDCGPCSVGQQCASNFDCMSGHLCAMPAHVCQ